MSAHFPCPIQEDIRDLFHDLLGRGAATSKAAERLAVDDETVALLAVYETDGGDPAVLCVVDQPLTCWSGAALSMVPAVVAQESIDKDELPENLVENTREVLNVLGRLLNSSHTPHVRLREVVELPASLDDGVAGLLAAPEFRRDFIATIEGYGEGRLSLLVA